MLQIKLNGAPVSLMARPRPDGGWDLRCPDPLVGEFRLRSGNGSVHRRWTWRSWRFGKGDMGN
jgi:hypothetical protein